MLEYLLAGTPLLLLVVSLLLGRYPGCDAIVRISERFSSRPRLRGAKSQSRPTAPPSQAIGGGLLIAFGLAQRPPPRPLISTG